MNSSLIENAKGFVRKIYRNYEMEEEIAIITLQ